MPSGQQLSVLNSQRFNAWVDERLWSKDWGQYIYRNQLNRSILARECGFAKSVLRQNPAIKKALQELEENLINMGILAKVSSKKKAKVNTKTNTIVVSSSKDKHRIKELEELNALLSSEILELKETMKRYKIFDEHLSNTGRMIIP